jgi:class 3 adenylate cyclase/tetratricopeptide (TPR) repeat protein
MVMADTHRAPILADRRLLSILSVDMVGSSRHVESLDLDDTQILLDAALSHIQMAVQQASGTVISFNGDGALAIFGWPDANEAHAERACEAAWNIQHKRDQSAGLSPAVQFRVGVNSGLITIRHIDLGATARLDAIGAPTHVAAGLQQAAGPGSIFISDTTAELCRGRLMLEPVAAAHAAGKLPGKAFRLCAAPSLRSPTPLGERFPAELVGRDRERAEIMAMLGANSKSARLLTLIGDPGLGKSHLASDIIRNSEREGRKVYVVEGHELGRSKSFAVFRDLLVSVLGARSLDVEAAILAELTGNESRSSINAVLETIGKEVSGSQTTQSTQTEIANIFAKLVQRLVLDSNCLLVVEDLHYIDPESRQVLKILARQSPTESFSILITARPEAEEAAMQIAEHIMWLTPLTDANMGLLCERTWPDRLLEPKQFARAIRQAAGNPLIFEQIMLHVAKGSAMSGTVLPQTIESLIHARIGKLSSPVQAAVQTLSLLGQRVDLKLAKALCGDVLDEGSDGLAQLESFAFIHRPDGECIRFRHALIAAACASTINRKRRREVHKAAIAEITRIHENLADYYPDLAHHAIGADDDAVAVEYLWLAARRARRTAASQSLMQLFDDAMACCKRLGAEGERRFVDFVLLSFETFHLVGAIDQIAPLIETAAEYAERQNRPDRQCAALCHAGITCWYQGRFADGVQIMHPALARAKSLDYLPLRFAAQFTLAQLYHNLGEIEKAYALILELCDLLTGDLEFARLGAMGLPASIAHSHAGYYILERGQYIQAELHCRRGLEIAINGRDAYSEVLARIGLGRTLNLQQRFAEALDCLAKAQVLIEAYGFDPANPNNIGLMCTALARSDRASEAIELAETCIAKGMLDRTGSYERHYFALGYGEALVSGGDLIAGFEQIDAAIAVGRKTSNPCILVQSMTLMAHLSALRMADTDATKRLIEERDAIAARFDLAPAPFNRS